MYGTIISTPAAHAISKAVGQFIVNCGLLELETYMWIHGFGHADPTTIEETKNERFHKRKERVIRVMNSLPIPQEFKNATKEIWDEASEIMKFRNVIAHSPVMATYNGPDKEPQWFIRMMDAKTMGSGNLREYMQEEIDGMTNRVHDLNRRMFNLREVFSNGTIRLNYTP